MDTHLETSRTEKNGKSYTNFACGKSFVSGRLSTTLADCVTCVTCKATTTTKVGGENPISADEVTAHLDTLKSIAARKNYLDANFTFLGVGTGRRVYDISAGKVLKLAINEKGQAQNEVETDRTLHDWYGDLFPAIYASSSEDKWIICEKAVDVRKVDFKNYFGVGMETLFYYIEDRLDVYPGKPQGKLISEELTGTCDEIEKIQELLDAIVNYDLMYRDIARKVSWGKIGQRLVVRDYGLTKAVWNEYYRPVKAGSFYVHGDKNARKVGAK